MFRRLTSEKYQVEILRDYIYYWDGGLAGFTPSIMLVIALQ